MRVDTQTTVKLLLFYDALKFLSVNLHIPKILLCNLMINNEKLEIVVLYKNEDSFSKTLVWPIFWRLAYISMKIYDNNHFASRNKLQKSSLLT